MGPELRDLPYGTTTFPPSVEGHSDTQEIMRLARCAIGAFGLAVTLSTASAHGQTAAGDKVTAEALFEEGRKLVSDGKYADACPKFADSERLDPSAATLLNLASCWEKVGHSASAWATYKEAASVANATGRRDYLAAAQRHADALAPTLAHLTLAVTSPVDGILVRRDGVNVDRAEWGTAIPIDPGTHTLAASASGYKDWSGSVDVTENGAPVTVTIPPLEPAPVDQTIAPIAPPIAPEKLAAPTGNEPPRAAEDGHPGNGQRLAGWIVGGAGVIGLAVGAGFAVAAKGKYNDSLGDCEANNHNLCGSTGLSERSDARTAGDVATALLVVGGAAVVGGAVLWLTAPGGKKEETVRSGTLLVAPTLGGAVLRGTW